MGTSETVDALGDLVDAFQKALDKQIRVGEELQKARQAASEAQIAYTDALKEASEARSKMIQKAAGGRETQYMEW